MSRLPSFLLSQRISSFCCHNSSFFFFFFFLKPYFTAFTMGSQFRNQQCFKPVDQTHPTNHPSVGHIHLLPIRRKKHPHFQLAPKLVLNRMEAFLFIEMQYFPLITFSVIETILLPQLAEDSMGQWQS